MNIELEIRNFYPIEYKGVKYPYLINSIGDILVFFKDEWKELKQRVDPRGYKIVDLHKKGFKKTIPVHRLVATMFCYNPDPENNIFVNHIDGNKLNDCASNLEWVTPKENVQHAFRTGLTVLKLSKKEVHEICRMLTDGVEMDIIAERFGICIPYLHSIYYKKAWREITSQYDFYDYEINHPLEKDQVVRIAEELMKGYTNVKIAKDLGINDEVVRNIRLKKTYAKWTKNYEFPISRPLTDINTVIKICELLQKGIRIFEVAKKLKVPRLVVCNIKNHIHYTNISKDYDFPDTSRVLKDKTVRKICKMLEKGKPVYKISKKLGINKSIIQDIRKKRTHRDISSEYNFSSKNKIERLTENEIRKICEELLKTENILATAKKFHKSECCVRKIYNKESWRNITKDYDFKYPNRLKVTHPFKIIENDKVKEICELLSKGYNVAQVSSKTGICWTTVNKIRKRKTHTDISKRYRFL